MIDYAIFGFGFAVVVVVGSALAILIIHNNRTLEQEAGSVLAMRDTGKASDGQRAAGG